MREPIDVNSLLISAAQADNAALPFARWKEDILKMASGYEGRAGAPIDLDAYKERKRRPSRLYRVSGIVASAAAVFIILLSVNGRFGSGASAPSPTAMQSRQFAGTGEEYAADSAMPEMAALEPAMEAPEAALEPAMEAPEAAPRAQSPMQDAGIYSGEGSADMGPAASQAAPLALDPLIDEAISAVNEALNGTMNGAKNETRNDTEDDTTGGATTENAMPERALPYAYSVTGGSFTLTPLYGGEEHTVTLETAYIVVCVYGSYLVQPLDMGGVEVLGEITATY